MFAAAGASEPIHHPHSHHQAAGFPVYTTTGDNGGMPPHHHPHHLQQHHAIGGMQPNDGYVMMLHDPSVGIPASADSIASTMAVASFGMNLFSPHSSPEAGQEELGMDGAQQTSSGQQLTAAGTARRKPGRKPLDPAIQKVKRKNQNREAQRKFRGEQFGLPLLCANARSLERKELYIKELEVKIKSIEEIVKESAAERDRLTNVIMQLQAENERLKAALEAHGIDAGQPAPVASQPAKLISAKNAAVASASASSPSVSPKRESSVSSNNSGVGPSIAAPNTTTNGDPANPVFNSITAAYASSVSSFIENQGEPEIVPLANVTLRDRNDSQASPAPASGGPSTRHTASLPPIHELFTSASTCTSPLAKTPLVTSPSRHGGVLPLSPPTTSRSPPSLPTGAAPPTTSNPVAAANLAILSAAKTTLFSRGMSHHDTLHPSDPTSVAWGLAASSITSVAAPSPTSPVPPLPHAAAASDNPAARFPHLSPSSVSASGLGPYKLPNASDVLNRAPIGWKPCAWPAGAKEDAPNVRMHTRVCSEILQTRAASLWQLRGPPPYHPVIDLIPCAEMRDKLIKGGEENQMDLELFAADVNACARCIGDPFVASSWRVPPEFWHRYPLMIHLATREYFECGLEDPKLAKEWAVKGIGCSNPRSDLVFPDV
ncbi:hypothetical protein HDU96_008950 [Phlyctochytrium bullatum]|nr:hypothetical protein HDU96_008950 [Phlyctochytrium bullatum]